jgi:hypothetical protein
MCKSGSSNWRPSITRTLYMVRPLKRPGFTHEDDVLTFLEGLGGKTLAAMEPYARPLR